MEVKQRILVATPLYPPEQGGPATYARMLEETLPQRGYNLTILPFLAYRRWPKVVRHVVYCFALLRRAKQADVVYALDPVSVGLPALVAAKLRRRPFLLRVPGDYAWEQGQVRFGVTDTLDTFIEKPRSYGFFVRTLFSLQSYVAKQAHTVVVPSQYMKRIVTAWGVHPASIVPIYSSLNPLQVSHDRLAVRERLGFTGTVLLTVTRLVPWKGVDTLVMLLPQLAASISDVQLVIIGDGPELPRLKQMVEQHNLTDRVHFYLPMKRSELGDFKLAADVFVLNTAYEGLSHDLLEVMDIGTPIVTTAVGGNPELVKDGITGLLVPYNDQETLQRAILRASAHDEFCAQLVQNARLRVRDFDQEKVITALDELLEKIP